MKRIIFLFLYVIVFPIIGHKVTGEIEGAFAFVALVSVPIYFCCLNKKTFHFILRVMY